MSLNALGESADLVAGVDAGALGEIAFRDLPRRCSTRARMGSTMSRDASHARTIAAKRTAPGS